MTSGLEHAKGAAHELQRHERGAIERVAGREALADAAPLHFHAGEKVVPGPLVHFGAGHPWQELGIALDVDDEVEHLLGTETTSALRRISWMAMDGGLSNRAQVYAGRLECATDPL